MISHGSFQATRASAVDPAATVAAHRRPISRVGGCLRTAGRPVAGRGVRSSLIGTIALSAGLRQVTYAGHPLYTYIADIGPGEITYVNIPQFGGLWPAMDAAGHEVK